MSNDRTHLEIECSTRACINEDSGEEWEDGYDSSDEAGAIYKFELKDRKQYERHESVRYTKQRAAHEYTLNRVLQGSRDTFFPVISSCYLVKIPFPP